MIFSKTNTTAWIVLPLVGLLAVSCSDRKNSQITNGDNATFYVDAVTGGFTTVETNSQSLANKKILSMSACLKDNAQTSSVNNLNFEVEAGDIQAVKKTDNKGCLHWQELVSYEATGVEKNISMNRSIKALDSHSGTQSFTITVNPWADQMTFRPDAQQESASAQGSIAYKTKDLKAASLINYDYDFAVELVENQLQSSIRRQTEITTLRLNYRNVDYNNFEVDSALNLTAKYNYVTSISISLLRQSLSELSPIKIKSGRFQFHLVFLKESADLRAPQVKDVLSAAQFSGKPFGDAGIIQEDVSVKFKDLAALSSRMKVLLSVSSLDEVPLFEDQGFEGVLNKITTNSDLEIALKTNPASAKMLYQAYHAQSSAPAKVVAAAENFRKIGFAAIQNAGVSYERERLLWTTEKGKADLNQIINTVKTDRSLTAVEKSALCAAYFQGLNKAELKAEYQACLKNPEASLNAEVRDFLVSVESKPTSVSIGDQETMDLTASFSLSESTNRKRGTSTGGTVGGEASGSLGATFGWNNTKPAPAPAPKIPITAAASASAKMEYKGEVSYVKDYVREEKDEKSVSVAKSEKLISDTLVLGLNVVSKSCLVMTVKAKLAEVAAKNKWPAGRYFCSNHETKSNHTEAYYFLNQERGSGESSIFDRNSAQVNPLRLFIRGERMNSYFRSILASDKFKFKIFIGKMSADKVTSDANNFKAEEMPGMLSAPEGQGVIFAQE